MVYLVVVVEVVGMKCCVFLDFGVGSLYVFVVLFERIGVKFYYFGLCKIKMMLGVSSWVMEVYWVKFNLVKGNFEMEVEVIKVEKLYFIMIDNFCYKKFVEKYFYLKGMIMDDNDERFCLFVYIILGYSECFRISIIEF